MELAKCRKCLIEINTEKINQEKYNAYVRRSKNQYWYLGNKEPFKMDRNKEAFKDVAKEKFSEIKKKINLHPKRTQFSKHTNNIQEKIQEKMGRFTVI